MSTDAAPQTGPTPARVLQTPRADAHAGDAAPAAGQRQEPQTLIAESIKYRRRAQDAERRAEALEAEVATLRQARDDRAAEAEAALAQARIDADALRVQLEVALRDQGLERELARAGCADTETGLAVARERLAGQDGPADPAAFVKALLQEKPHLRGGRRAAPPTPPLPPPTAGAKPPAEDRPARAAQRLADRARETGRPADVMAYVRARRGR